MSFSHCASWGMSIWHCQKKWPQIRINETCGFGFRSPRNGHPPSVLRTEQRTPTQIDLLPPNLITAVSALQKSEREKLWERKGYSLVEKESLHFYRGLLQENQAKGLFLNVLSTIFLFAFAKGSEKVDVNRLKKLWCSSSQSFLSTPPTPTRTEANGHAGLVSFISIGKMNASRAWRGHYHKVHWIHNRWY